MHTTKTNLYPTPLSPQPPPLTQPHLCLQSQSHSTRLHSPHPTQPIFKSTPLNPTPVNLKIAVDDASAVHVFEAKDDFECIEADFLFAEDAVLRQVVVQVTPIHQVKDEAELLWRLKSVRHADDERTALLKHPEENHHQCKTSISWNSIYCLISEFHKFVESVNNVVFEM